MVLVIACFYFVAVPVWFLVNNPEITIGQLLQKFWLEYVLSMAFGIGYVFYNPIHSEIK